MTTIFEVWRPHLRSVAHRLLGTTADADDAVQDAWLRVREADAATIDNPRAWLTTAVSRVCLDRLRSPRNRHIEVSLDTIAHSWADGAEGPEQASVRSDAVAEALLSVLSRLTQLERVAFVLHDIFAIRHGEVAHILDVSPAAARQLASRGRRRVRAGGGESFIDLERKRVLLDTFLFAARNGDLAALVELLAPDVRLTYDAAAAARVGGPEEVVGRHAVASVFSGAARAAVSALIDGDVGVAVVAVGRVAVVLDITVTQGRIAAIRASASQTRLDSAVITPLTDPSEPCR